MLHPQPRPRLDESRFHGTLRAADATWQIYFVDVSRVERDWIIECMAVAPRLHHVTIRCRPRSSPGDTARRVMAALREWLVSGDHQDVAQIEVADGLERAN